MPSATIATTSIANATSIGRTRTVARRSGCAEREQRSTDRQGRAAREGDDAVVSDEDSGRRGAVETEQSGHHPEGTADENGSAVVAAGADDQERQGRGDCGAGAERDDEEVQAAAEVDLLASYEVEHGGRHARDHGRRGEHGNQAILHRRAYRHDGRPGGGPSCGGTGW